MLMIELKVVQTERRPRRRNRTVRGRQDAFKASRYPDEQVSDHWIVVYLSTVCGSKIASCDSNIAQNHSCLRWKLLPFFCSIGSSRPQQAVIISSMLVCNSFLLCCWGLNRPSVSNLSVLFHSFRFI